MTPDRDSILATLPLHREACFSDAGGRYRRRLEKRGSKLLAGAAPLLGRVLEPGERITQVIPACSPYSALELLTTGWIIGVVKRCFLVVTDRRLLHLPARGDYRPRGSVSELRFADMERARIKGLLAKSLEVRYRDGKRETFTGLSGPDAKKLSLVLEMRAGTGEPGAAGGRRFLCPYCAQALAPEDSRCDVCGFAFRQRRKALLWSLLLPGGGYFYTGHGVLGLLDALVEGILLLAVVSGSVLALQGEPAIWPEVFAFAAILGLEKMVTIFHAQHYVREFLPVNRRAALEAAAAGPLPGTAPAALEPGSTIAPAA